ncbi:MULTISPECIES: hypothetical protein [Niastella]|uniref:Uncharacterized protein n=1 Tax=Niastella soli TaxID=2821487 RepID=A0ABS3Z373_9BACT|nr:hypothetical protein [Niastella soli]MBO9204623.1 hypothetical protein [Niastella soli]
MKPGYKILVDQSFSSLLQDQINSPYNIYNGEDISPSITKRSHAFLPPAIPPLFRNVDFYIIKHIREAASIAQT